MMIDLVAKYVNGQAKVVKSTYSDGSVALVLLDRDGHRLLTATVALEGQVPDEGNVFLKDWSENAGIVEGLQKAGIVGPVIREIPTGFVNAKEAKLLVGLED